MPIVFIILVFLVLFVFTALKHEFYVKHVRYEIIETDRCGEKKYKPIRIVSFMGIKFKSWVFNRFGNEYQTVDIAKAKIQINIDWEEEREKAKYCDKHKTKKVIPYDVD